ncbi:MFS transporter [Chitinophaga agrisoli]|uniref:MFS transporter n=1 Tax=Chitinophaga agrisoli TaxID=2607653 RepID=A0A5B2VNR1_9BACT|nr:MFS transporter [Chitinophaga agrisoli]KAA2239942.1 MFS transporter [Chitinophaga agrisoli]
MLLKIAHTYRSSFSDLSRETWLLSFVLLVNRSSTMVAPFMSMYITQSKHRSIADAGLIITLFGVGAVLGSTVSGYFIDKFSFRAVQLFSSIIGGLLFLLFGHIDSFTGICIMTVLLSFVVEAFRPANAAAVAAYSTPENLTRSYSLNRLAMNIGWAVGSSMAGILAAINYHLLFWVEGGVYLVVGGLVLVLLPPAKPAVKPVTAVVSTAPAASSPWKDPYLFRFLLLVTIYMSCFMMLFRLVPVYWKEELHINEASIGLLMGLNGVLIAMLEMVLVRYWESRRSNMYYIVSGVIATALGYGLLELRGMPSMLIAVGTVLFLTAGEMLAFPFINTVIMSRANEQTRGKYAASFAMTWSIAQIAGPGGGALLADSHGYSVLWVVLVAACLVCAGGFQLLKRRKAQPVV